MSIYEAFGTNEELENKGIELTVSENKDGTPVKFYVARAGKSNKKYQKALETTFKPYRRQIQLGTMSEETATALMTEVFATTILKGWENVRGKDGKDIPFNKDNAVMLLTALPDLYETLSSAASDAANFRDETLAEDAKN